MERLRSITVELQERLSPERLKHGFKSLIRRTLSFNRQSPVEETEPLSVLVVCTTTSSFLDQVHSALSSLSIEFRVLLHGSGVDEVEETINSIMASMALDLILVQGGTPHPTLVHRISQLTGGTTSLVLIGAPRHIAVSLGYDDGLESLSEGGLKDILRKANSSQFPPPPPPSSSPHPPPPPPLPLLLPERMKDPAPSSLLLSLLKEVEELRRKQELPKTSHCSDQTEEGLTEQSNLRRSFVIAEPRAPYTSGNPIAPIEGSIEFSVPMISPFAPKSMSPSWARAREESRAKEEETSVSPAGLSRSSGSPVQLSSASFFMIPRLGQPILETETGTRTETETETETRTKIENEPHAPAKQNRGARTEGANPGGRAIGSPTTREGTASLQEPQQSSEGGDHLSRVLLELDARIKATVLRLSERNGTDHEGEAGLGLGLGPTGYYTAQRSQEEDERDEPPSLPPEEDERVNELPSDPSTNNLPTTLFLLEALARSGPASINTGPFRHYLSRLEFLTSGEKIPARTNVNRVSSSFGQLGDFDPPKEGSPPLESTIQTFKGERMERAEEDKQAEEERLAVEEVRIALERLSKLAARRAQSFERESEILSRSRSRSYQDQDHLSCEQSPQDQDGVEEVVAEASLSRIREENLAFELDDVGDDQDNTLKDEKEYEAVLSLMRESPSAFHSRF